MQLITEELKKVFEAHPLYSTDGTPRHRKKVLAKYFGGSACTWLVYEAKLIQTEDQAADWLFFGDVTIDGDEWEMGYFTLSQLAELRFPPFGLPIERDLYLEPAKKTFHEI